MPTAFAPIHCWPVWTESWEIDSTRLVVRGADHVDGLTDEKWVVAVELFRAAESMLAVYEAVIERPWRALADSRRDEAETGAG